MAQQAVQMDQDQFCCSICLDLMKEPVTVPCGHNYCSMCIEGYWSKDDQRGKFSCPQCRHTFIPRPVLKKNTMLADMMELLKKTGLQDVPLDHCYAGPGDVACDVCTGRKLKAVKTCLQCLVSFCDTHLQPHYESPAFKKHKLVKASLQRSSDLQENICSQHDEVRKLFCCTDQQCICSLCSVEEHKGHNIVSAAAERTERQKELDTIQQNVKQRIQEREKDMKVLHQEVKSINHCADRATDDSDTIFKEMISSIKRRRSEVRELIRDHQKREVSRTEEMRTHVEQEVTELRKRHADLEQISQTEDHIHFLHSYTSLSRISESTQPVSSNACPLRDFEDVTVTVSKMRDKLEDILKEEQTNVSETVNRADVSLSKPAEPKTRAEFLQYSCPITLDPNTAHQHLSLSKGNRKVTVVNHEQSYPQHTERFTEQIQVMSSEGLTGRCYWEVEWRELCVHIAALYKDISRTGGYNESGFGSKSSDKSWCLQCQTGCYLFIHGGIGTEIAGPVSSRVGVYLDHSAGTLSFYRVSNLQITEEQRPQQSVSDTMTLLHRVHTTFTQPLYAGFGFLCGADTAELCDL